MRSFNSNIKFMKKISLWLIAFNLLIAGSASAADNKITSWKIDNSKSKIEFATQQNSTPVTGSFTKFSGTINFNKANLKDSNVKIIVDLNSFNASLPDAVEVLKEKGWFDVKQFPNAEFRSQKFTQISENKFRAEGFLKLKGTELPTTLDFSFDQYSATQAIAKGEAKINRLNFGVGKKDENNIKDIVVIKFTIIANN